MLLIENYLNSRFGTLHGKARIKRDRLSRLSFFLFAGHALGLSVAHALVLSFYGLRGVAEAYVVTGAVALAIFLIQSVLKRFITGIRMLLFTTSILTVLLLTGPLYPKAPTFYPWILVGTFCTWIVTTLQLWIITGDFLSPGESKKILPLIAIGGLAGTLCGGLLTWTIASWLSPLWMLTVWGLLMAAAVMECRIIQRLTFPDRSTRFDFESEQLEGHKSTPFKLTPWSPFLASVWLFTLFAWMVMTQIDMAFFSHVLDAYIGSANSISTLAALLGLIHAAGALIGIVMRLRVTNPLLTILGVGNSLLVLPALSLVVLVSLSFSQLSFLATVGRIIRIMLYGPLHLVATAALYHPIPGRYRSKARRFADGVAVPLGISGTGVLFLAISSGSSRLLLVVPMLWIASIILVKRLYVKALIQNLEDTNYYVRFAAIEGLGRSRDRRAVKALIRAIDDRNVSIRLNAAVALGQLGVQEALEPLSRALSDNDELVRAEAARSLGKLGNPEAATPLIDVFRRESADRVKATIIKALGTLGDVSVVGLLCDHLKHQDSRVRANAIEALADVGGDVVGDMLLPLLDDANNRVRANAVVALWKLSHKRGIVQGTEALRQMLASPVPLMRASAAAAMGMIGDESFFQLLMECLQDPDPQVRRNAGKAMEQLPSIPKVAPLLKILADDDSTVSQSAVKILSRTPEAIEPLISALSSANPRVRANAALALASGGYSDAIDSLAMLLKDFNPEVRLRAVEAISRMDDHRIREWIFPLLDDDNDAVRATAVSALPRTGESDISSHLLKRLDDTSWRVRANALEALETVEYGDLLECAVRILESEQNSRVKAIAARILCKADDPLGRECITQMTESPDKWARVNAIYALRDIADPSLIQLLMKALSDPDPDVRRNALAALETVGGEVVESLLKVVRESGSLEITDEETNLIHGIPVPGVQAIEGAREVKRLSFKSLQELGTIPEPAMLASMMRDEVTRARSSLSLLRSLQSLGNYKALAPLFDMLKDRMKNSRNLALEAFGHITGKPDNITAITRSLGGTGEINHDEVIEILGSFGEKELLKELVLYLKEEWESQSSRASKGGLETLASLLQSEEQPVLRGLAVSAIAEIGITRLLSPLENALQDDSPDVRERAREGLERIQGTVTRLSASHEQTEPCNDPPQKHT